MRYPVYACRERLCDTLYMPVLMSRCLYRYVDGYTHVSIETDAMSIETLSHIDRDRNKDASNQGLTPKYRQSSTPKYRQCSTHSKIETIKRSIECGCHSIGSHQDTISHTNPWYQLETISSATPKNQEAITSATPKNQESCNARIKMDGLKSRWTVWDQNQDRVCERCRCNKTIDATSERCRCNKQMQQDDRCNKWCRCNKTIPFVRVARVTTR